MSYHCRTKEGLSIDDMHDKEVIKDTLDFLCKTIGVCGEIYQFPDRIQRNSPACDVLATVGKRKVAVEHTSVDSYLSQRRDDDIFRQVLGPLENDLRGKLPPPGHYRLCVDVNTIPTGIDWAVLRQSIRQWCLEVAPTLTIRDPFTMPGHFARETPKGVPLELTLYRFSGRDGEFRVARFSPSDLEDQRRQVMQEILASRGLKIAAYQKDGYRTILVLESNDIALANDVDIGQAFVWAANRSSSDSLPDEVHLVQTEVKPYDFWCLKFDDASFPNAEIAREPYATQYDSIPDEKSMLLEEKPPQRLMQPLSQGKAAYETQVKLELLYQENYVKPVVGQKQSPGNRSTFVYQCEGAAQPSGQLENRQT